MLFAGVYVIAVAIGIMLLAHTGQLADFVPAGTFFLMVLATYRLVQLFTRDSITDFIREWGLHAPRVSLRGTVRALFSCVWCMGLWIAPFVLFAYFADTYFWYVIVILALSALGSILQIITEAINSHSEK